MGEELQRYAEINCLKLIEKFSFTKIWRTFLAGANSSSLPSCEPQRCVGLPQATSGPFTDNCSGLAFLDHCDLRCAEGYAANGTETDRAPALRYHCGSDGLAEAEGTQPRCNSERARRRAERRAENRRKRGFVANSSREKSESLIHHSLKMDCKEDDAAMTSNLPCCAVAHALSCSCFCLFVNRA